MYVGIDQSPRLTGVFLLRGKTRAWFTVDGKGWLDMEGLATQILDRLDSALKKSFPYARWEGLTVALETPVLLNVRNAGAYRKQVVLLTWLTHFLEKEGAKVLEINPMHAKVAAVGKATASKEEMVHGIEGTLRKQTGKTKLERQAVCDAAGLALAARIFETGHPDWSVAALGHDDGSASSAGSIR